jgi:hypothetical protein
MGYVYADERSKLFTEDGQVTFLKIRDNVKRLLSSAGAFTSEKAMASVSGDSWMMLAALDRMVELKEIRKVTADGTTWGQHQVFTGYGS